MILLGSLRELPAPALPDTIVMIACLYSSIIKL